VENIPLQAERHSGRRQKLFAFPPESAFGFRPECCSESQRNGVQLRTGIAFTFDRIPQLKVNNAHSGALKRSKVARFRLYDLRHTWATRAAMSGIDLVTLAAMLGHSRIQMVLRYAHPTEQHQAQAMKRLEEFNTAKQIAEFEENPLATDFATVTDSKRNVHSAKC
jgi:integrase